MKIALSACCKAPVNSFLRGSKKATVCAKCGQDAKVVYEEKVYVHTKKVVG